MKLLNLDHADVRVASIAAVEPFYDAVLIPLGLSRKQRAHVAKDGEWHDVQRFACAECGGIPHADHAG